MCHVTRRCHDDDAQLIYLTLPRRSASRQVCSCRCFPYGLRSTRPINNRGRPSLSGGRRGQCTVPAAKSRERIERRRQIALPSRLIGRKCIAPGAEYRIPSSPALRRTTTPTAPTPSQPGNSLQMRKAAECVCACACVSVCDTKTRTNSTAVIIFDVIHHRETVRNKISKRKAN